MQNVEQSRHPATGETSRTDALHGQLPKAAAKSASPPAIKADWLSTSGGHTFYIGRPRNCSGFQAVTQTCQMEQTATAAELGRNNRFAIERVEEDQA